MRLAPSTFAITVALIGFGLVASPVQADPTPHQRLKKQVRDLVQEVKDAPTAVRKREILDDGLRTMIEALDRVESMKKLSEQDQDGVDALRSNLQAKLDELHGQNGYEAVPAGQLNSFADYVQQDLEQADTITISVTTALLIVILIILLA